MTTIATTCLRTGKQRFTREQANRRAAWWRRVRFARMRHDYCDYCSAWHVANDRSRPRRRKW